MGAQQGGGEKGSDQPESGAAAPAAMSQEMPPSTEGLTKASDAEQAKPVEEKSPAPEPAAASAAADSKSAEPKSEEPKTEQPKAEEPKSEEPKSVEPKAVESKAVEPKSEELKSEEPKSEEPKSEEPKSEEAKGTTEEKKEGGGKGSKGAKGDGGEKKSKRKGKEGQKEGGVKGNGKERVGKEGGKSKDAAKGGGKDFEGGGKGKGKVKGGAKGEGKGKGKGLGGAGGGMAKGTAVVPASGPFGGGNGYRLNVKNFGKDMTDDKLRALFEPYGTVSMAQVKKDESGESRGFGFVVLSTQEAGEKAAEIMNGKDVNGKKLIVGAAERRVVPEEDPMAACKGGKGMSKGGPMAMNSTMAMNAQMQHMYMQMAYNMYLQQYLQQAGNPYNMQPPPAAAAAAAAAAAGAGPAQTEYEGSLKSLSTHNNYGFIVCAQTFAIYNRDVYVEQKLLPEGVERGTRLVFTIDENERGHPKAVQCRRAL